jgi:5-methylcytosine-specific restriction endonuclease McrA
VDILSTLSSDQAKTFRRAQLTEGVCAFVIVLSIFGAFILITNGKPFLVIMIPILLGLASWIAQHYVRSFFTGPKYDEINRHRVTLYPTILQDERRKRIEFEQFYTSPEWRILRKSFLRTQRKKTGLYICDYCNRPIAHDELTIDHFKPRSKYPDLALTMSNLRIAHRQCNSSKGSTDPRDEDIGSPNEQSD